MSEHNSKAAPEERVDFDAHRRFGMIFQNLAGDTAAPLGFHFMSWERERVSTLANLARDVKQSISCGLQGIGHTLEVAAATGELPNRDVDNIGSAVAMLAELGNALDLLEADARHVLAQQLAPVARLETH